MRNAWRIGFGIRLLAAASIWSLFISICLALPDGFVEEEIVGVKHPLDIAFAPRPNGAPPMMLVISRNGLLHIFEDSDRPSSPTLAGDFSEQVCSSPAGLVGIEVHPDFVSNRYIYLYYTYRNRNNPIFPCGIPFLNAFLPRNRLSRFVLRRNNTLDIQSEQVLILTPPTSDHTGGGIQFGKDGHLYVSVGDGTMAGSLFRPFYQNAPQNLGNLLGKVLRITDDGGVPPDNPYVSSGESSQRCHENDAFWPGVACQEIYMAGLRNPFRLVMDPNADKVRFFIHDVGLRTWEWIHEGGPAAASKRGGWPAREGPCITGSDTECAVDEQYLDPVFYYPHDGRGGCLGGGAFVPNGVWPAEYDNRYIYAEFVRSQFQLLSPDPSNKCRDCVLPRSAYQTKLFHEWPNALAVRFGSYKGSQALYYTAALNQLGRIVYVGEDNHPPTAKIAVTSLLSTVDAGQHVTLDATSSSDPDGDALSFDWHFGDGTSGSGSTVMHAFATDGIYICSVTVTDGVGGHDRVHVEITVGDPQSTEPEDEMDDEDPGFWCTIPLFSVIQPGC